MLLDYDHPASWPPAVTAFLDEHLDLLDDWVTTQRFATGFQYDRLVERLGELLLSVVRTFGTTRGVD